MSLGSLTLELTDFLSKTLHEASDFGTIRKNYWSSSDMMYWMKIHKRTNFFGAFMQVTWARKSRFGCKMLMEIQNGVDSTGWKRFAIGLDSLNQNTKNWGEDVFPSAFFAGRSRAYNDSPKSTLVDALGHSDTLGDWRFGVVCKKPISTILWSDLGNYILKSTHVHSPFEIFPVDDLKAVICSEDANELEELICLKTISFNNWCINFSPWSPSIHRSPTLSSKGIYWLSFLGVPLNFWTPEIIRSLCIHCGEFLLISANTLSLEDTSSIKVKIRNNKGPNDIPRILNLKTPEGDFEIHVHIIPIGKTSFFPINGKVLIQEVGDDQLAGEGASKEVELSTRVENTVNVAIAEEAFSDNWHLKEKNKQRNFKSLPINSKHYGSDNRPTGSFCSKESYTTLSNQQSLTWKKKGLGKRRQNRIIDKSLTYKSGRWVPKPLSLNNSLGPIISHSNSVQNSNLNLNTSTQVMVSQDLFGGATDAIGPKRSYIGALLGAPQVSEKGPQSFGRLRRPILLPNLISNSNFTELQDSAALTHSIDSDEGTSINLLIDKHIKVGTELGISFGLDKSKAKALFHKSILLDKQAASISKLPICDRIEDLVNDYPLTAAEIECSRTKSYETPVAIFQDPMEWWENSQMREDFLYDEADFINIPPGFDQIFPPPPGFETPKLRRKGIRLEIYRKIEEVPREI